MSRSKIIICAVTLPAIILAVLFGWGFFTPSHTSTSVIIVTPLYESSSSDIIDCFNFDQISSNTNSHHAKIPSMVQKITSSKNLRIAIADYQLDELSKMNKAELLDRLRESTTIKLNEENNEFTVTISATTAKLAEQYSYAIITSYKNEKRKEAIQHINLLQPKLVKQIRTSQQQLDQYRYSYNQARLETDQPKGTLLHYDEGYRSKTDLALAKMRLESERLSKLKDSLLSLTLHGTQPNSVFIKTPGWNQQTATMMSQK